MPNNSEHELPLPWGPFLDELDEAISEPIALYCIGGFVVSLLYGLPRPTGDVDYIAVIPRYRMDELEQLVERRCRQQSAMVPWIPVPWTSKAIPVKSAL